ncbi:MAG: GNAT family N-acetyltransferase [Cytophagales bacterium]|nr:GNAT family N-acetyltransferase [Rhizobacter sp.]
MKQPVASLSSHDLSWKQARLNELTPLELARIYRARQEVFSIEQNCVYLDADEADEQSYHLAAWSDEQVLPLAYARLVDPGIKYAEPSMGRVITTAAVRGTGLGRELVQRVLALCDEVHPGLGVRISAQSRLLRFYNELGFVAVGEGYMEDGIPHIEMLRPGERS